MKKWGEGLQFSQQNDAVAHVGFNTMAALRDRIFIHSSWWVHSPGLTPCDCHLWESLEDNAEDKLKVVIGRVISNCCTRTSGTILLPVHQVPSMSDSWSRSFPTTPVTCGMLFFMCVLISNVRPLSLTSVWVRFSIALPAIATLFIVCLFLNFYDTFHVVFSLWLSRVRFPMV